MDEFFRISTCEMAKEIWDTLVETHEGTTKVKRSRLNTFESRVRIIQNAALRINPKFEEKIRALEKSFKSTW